MPGQQTVAQPLLPSSPTAVVAGPRTATSGWRVVAVLVAVAAVLLQLTHLAAVAGGEPAAVTTQRLRWLWAGCSLLAAAAVVVGVTVHRPARRAPWTLTAVVLVIWAVHPLVDLLAGSPLPAEAEAALVIVALGLMVAIGITLLRSAGGRLDLPGRLDAAVIVVGYLGLLLPTQIVPALTGAAALPVRVLLGVLAPLAVAASLVTMTRLLFVGATRSWSFRLLLLGYAALVLPPAVLGVGLLGSDDTSSPVRTAALVLFVGAAALDPSMRGLAEPPAGPRDPELSRWRFAAMVVAGCLPGAGLLLTSGVVRWERALLLAIAATTIALIVLRSWVAARMWSTATRDLRRRSTTDGLTGLANWRGVHERLAGATAPVAVLCCDLDSFGRVNAVDGHTAGDDVLRAVAQRMLDLVPDGALIGRLGNDEFVVVLGEDPDREDVLALARTLRSALGRPVALTCGRTVRVTASIGVSFSGPDRVTDPDVFPVLTREADLALHEVKRDGGNGVAVYTAELGVRAQREAEIRAALERTELLQVHYQGVVDLADGRVVGAEALVRLTVPGLGSVPPDEFVPIAVRTGQIVGLGSWVLDTALAEYRAARPELPVGFTLAVNVSTRQLDSGALVDVVQRAVGDDRVAAAALRLEITESEITGPGAVRELQRLADAGFHLAIDDFGTEYASLQYLTGLPVSVLKLDRSFVDRLLESRADRAVVQHVIALGHDLGIEIIAEGVEREEQADLLRGLRCRRAQGYLFDRPAPGLARFAVRTTPRRVPPVAAPAARGGAAPPTASAAVQPPGQPPSAASMSEARSAGEVVEP